jgi:hypothetical protein
MILENITVVRNVALNSLETPKEIKVPHGATKFPIGQDIDALFLLLRYNLLDISSLSFLVAWKGIIEGILDIIAAFDFILEFPQVCWTKKGAN